MLRTRRASHNSRRRTGVQPGDDTNDMNSDIDRSIAEVNTHAWSQEADTASVSARTAASAVSEDHASDALKALARSIVSGSRTAPSTRRAKSRQRSASKKRKRDRRAEIPRAAQRKSKVGESAEELLPGVKLVWDLSNDLAYEYSLSRVADTGPWSEQWTSTRLQNFCIYADGPQHRFELAQLDDSTLGPDGHLLYRWSSVKAVMTLDQFHMAALSTPLPFELTNVLHDKLDWSEFHWAHDGVIIKGQFYRLHTIRFQRRKLVAPFAFVVHDRMPKAAAEAINTNGVESSAKQTPLPPRLIRADPVVIATATTASSTPARTAGAETSMASPAAAQTVKVEPARSPLDTLLSAAGCESPVKPTPGSDEAAAVKAVKEANKETVKVNGHVNGSTGRRRARSQRRS